MTLSIFPKAEARFKFAILFSFFPCAILYSLHYPVPDIITLGIWVCAFPSAIGLLSLLLLPLFPSQTYGYFAYNLFCVIATFTVAIRVGKSISAIPQSIPKLYKFTRNCMYLTLFIAIWQVFDGSMWQGFFPDMSGLDTARGAGLRTEPSLLAALLAIYLSIAVSHLYRSRRFEQKSGSSLVFEALALILSFLLVTRSLSVLLVAVCFIPALVPRMRHALVAALASLSVATIVFGARIMAAVSDTGGSLLLLITVGIKSWRNVPDILILTNPRQYLLPGNPAQTRDLLNSLATAWSPLFAWLDNTYSTFSASASTLGLIVTAWLFIAGIVFSTRRPSSFARIRLTWLSLYVTAWFILPKYEPMSWIALSLLGFSFNYVVDDNKVTQQTVVRPAGNGQD